MEVSHFKIYSASAGSGKTYSLTREYLKLLLTDTSPSKFRQILAITFTNKAVGEMKTRILENLYQFGNETDPENLDPLFLDLCEELAISAQKLKERSQLVLKRILHNYSFFEVSTIDRFNHKIIKTFARDLQLSQNFEVELDTDLLLQEAVGRLLERAGSNDELTQVLIAFSLEKIDEDKSWNIAYDLVDIGKLLFQENHSGHIGQLGSKSMNDFTEIQSKMASKISAIESKVRSVAAGVLQEISNQGYEPEDFPRQTLPNHFNKISKGQFNIKTLYANKLEQSLQEGRILKASDTRDGSHLASSILDYFLSIKKDLYQRSYLKNIYGNLVPMTLLNEIAKEIKNIELEREVIPISALNSLLSKEIRNQPVPFIYERMGEKYRHYFIDEFQDTSQVQWENLIPLIGNALEGVNEKNEQGSLFLVGDIKQAIYRWRGGKAEQFLDLLSKNSHPFVLAPSVFNLDTNWRSYSEIVQFNNSFFTTVAPFLKNTDYQNLFLQGCQQKPNAKQGGYVQLSFLDQTLENKEAEYCKQVFQIINEVKAAGYDYSDICILVRKNDHGMLVANFLSENHIPIVSSESLLLKNNPSVHFLLSLLGGIENESDQEAIYAVLIYLAEGKSDPHQFIASHLQQLEVLLLETYGFNLKEMKTQPVLYILEKAIGQFDLADKSPAYLTFLMDEALAMEKKEGSGIHIFLKHWNQKKDSLSIAAPDHLNAVTIMTIHKSKGLEFPVVIFPFANALIDDKRKKKKSWVPATADEKLYGLDEFLINSKREMLDYNKWSKETYLEEVEKTELDALNVLYVALTRAEKACYVISEDGKSITSLEQATSYSDLFRYYLDLTGKKGHANLFSFGVLPPCETNTKDTPGKDATISYRTRPKGDEGFAISTRSSRLWNDERREALELGNLIHFALSQIVTLEDVDRVLKSLGQSGHLALDATDYVTEKILQVIHHPKLNCYFTDTYKVLNECEILTAAGKSLRPDRIALIGKEATILDYKTGKQAPSHKEQITQYADVLKAMGYQIRDTIIVYIDQEINPIFL